jgi:hypothetical protein
MRGTVEYDTVDLGFVDHLLMRWKVVAEKCAAEHLAPDGGPLPAADVLDHPLVLVGGERLQRALRCVVHARAAVRRRQLQLRARRPPPDEARGLSASALDGGRVYHTYSTYSRGLDPMNSGYQLLDLAPNGRDEGGLDWSMAWLRRHDAYDTAAG